MDTLRQQEKQRERERERDENNDILATTTPDGKLVDTEPKGTNATDVEKDGHRHGRCKMNKKHWHLCVEARSKYGY